MPLFRKIETRHGLLALWEMNEDLASLRLAFPMPVGSPLPNLKSEKRQIEWISTRLLLHEIVPGEWFLHYDGQGRPILEHAQYKHISISHSSRFAGVLLHQNKRVGIDIESTGRKFEKIKEKYLSPKEIRQTEGSAHAKCLYWCAKEAVYKLCGIAGLEFSSQLAVLPFEPETSGTFQLKLINEEQERLYSLSYLTIDDQLVVAVSE